MDELEALNMLLRLIGTNPVNDITTAHPDVANARTTLNRIRKKIQKRGWWFNIDYKVIYQPDPTSLEIRIPKEVISYVGDGEFGHVVRGNKLYDKVNQTYQFAANVTAHRQVRLLDWNDMPVQAQEYAAYYAASEFVRDELEDPSKERELKEEAARELIELKSEDLKLGQYNIFNSSRIARARAGVSPYNRGSKRFHGDPDV